MSSNRKYFFSKLRTIRDNPRRAVSLALDRFKRPVKIEVPPREKSTVLLRANKNSNRLYFVFTGVAQNLMMHPSSFFNKTGIWDHNLVMLRDPSKGLYQGNISEEMPDFLSTKARLLDYKKQLNCEEVYCVGTSAGAYAAIVFGHYMEVDAVSALAAPTKINAARMRRNYSLSRSWKLPAIHSDLTKLLANYNGKTKYHLYYCKDHQHDNEQAERLSSCSGVTLHPQEGDTHVVVKILEKSGQLETLFHFAKNI